MCVLDSRKFLWEVVGLSATVCRCRTLIVCLLRHPITMSSHQICISLFGYRIQQCTLCDGSLDRIHGRHGGPESYSFDEDILMLLRFRSCWNVLHCTCVKNCHPQTSCAMEAHTFLQTRWVWTLSMHALASRNSTFSILTVELKVPCFSLQNCPLQINCLWSLWYAQQLWSSDVCIQRIFLQVLWLQSPRCVLSVAPTVSRSVAFLVENSACRSNSG